MPDFFEDADSAAAVPARSREEPLTVSELTAHIRARLETEFADVRLRGEVSGLRVQSSGHAYFTLKDAGAQISAVVWRTTLARSKTRLRDGMQLVAHGKISVWPPRGNYQLVVTSFSEEGEGRLLAEYEALRRRLEAEGLFDKARKREIPRLARAVAFVTSPTGAAIRDFISIMRRRDWAGTLYVVPAKVQGAGAAEEIVRGIRLAEKIRGLDVIVVGRGGGSIEDLWCFNEEIVARAVRASRVPVISAVGHEIDFTLSDFAADLRAETPSAAAEHISSGRLDAVERARDAAERLEGVASAALEDFSQRLDMLEMRLERRSPHAYLALMRERADALGRRFASAADAAASGLRDRLEKARFRLERNFPGARVELAKVRLGQLAARLSASGLDATLKRGFAVARDAATGEYLDSARAISLGREVVLRFGDGETRVEGRDLQ
ncbi:MAG: exodeoxyribonuclease VII large subunit [Candidatus Spyradosoma sp.]